MAEASESKQLRILVIEDEFLVAVDIVGGLVEEGFGEVVHASTEAAALRHLEQGPWNAVVADANLNGKNIANIGGALLSRGIPFVIVSGYSREDLPMHLQSAPLLGKPVAADQLVRTVRRLCGL